MKKNVLKYSVLGLAALAVVSCSNDENEFQDANTNLIVEQENAVFNEQTGFSQDIPGQYIVVYNTNEVENFGKSFVSYTDSKEAVNTLTSEILGLGKSATNTLIVNTFAKSIMGVAVQLDDNQVAALRSDKRVAYVENDKIVQFPPPCGTPNGGP